MGPGCRVIGSFTNLSCAPFLIILLPKYHLSLLHLLQAVACSPGSCSAPSSCFNLSAEHRIPAPPVSSDSLFQAFLPDWLTMLQSPSFLFPETGQVLLSEGFSALFSLGKLFSSHGCLLSTLQVSAQKATPSRKQPSPPFLFKFFPNRVVFHPSTLFISLLAFLTAWK